MNIIYDPNTENVSEKYTIYTILSIVTFKKVKRIEDRKKELADRLMNLYSK